MTQPGEGELFRLIGRVENQLAQVLSKLDTHTERLAKFEVRREGVEADHQELKAGLNASVTQRLNWRQGVAIALLTAGSGGIASWVVNLLSAHH